MISAARPDSEYRHLNESGEKQSVSKSNSRRKSELIERMRKGEFPDVHVYTSKKLTWRLGT